MISRNTRFIILGAGAVGGVIGARLRQSGWDVTFVARGRHFEAMRSDGLVLETPDGTSRLDVTIVDDAGDTRIDDNTVVLLCVKSQDTATALATMARHAPQATPIVCVQNGVANERTALRFFPNVYGVTVMCPTGFLEPGVVCAYSTPTTGILDIGRYPTGVDVTCSLVADAFTDSTFLSVARPDIMRWKYRKLMLNLGNAVDALCGPGARRGRVTALANEEGERVLAAGGIDPISVDDDRERRADHIRVGTIGDMRRPGGSMWQSLHRQTPSTEVDYLSGEIVQLGRIHGIPTPVNSLLQRLVWKAAASDVPAGTATTESAILEMLGKSGIDESRRPDGYR